MIYLGNYSKRRKRLLLALLRRQNGEHMERALQDRIAQLWHFRYHDGKQIIGCRLCNP